MSTPLARPARAQLWRDHAHDLALRLDAVAAPAHLHSSDADARPAFSCDQSRSCAMGSPGHSLVCARLYRGPCPGMAACSPDRLRRPILERAKAAERRQHRRPARLLRLRRHYWRSTWRRAVLRSAVLLLTPDRDIQNLARRNGLSWRLDWRADWRPLVLPPLPDAGIDGP